MLELQLKKLNSRYTAPPKIGLDWLNKILFLNCHGRASMERTLSTDTWGPISREDYFCGSSKEEIKRESIRRPKDRVNSHDRESLKTALPYLQMIIKH